METSPERWNPSLCPAVFVSQSSQLAQRPILSQLGLSGPHRTNPITTPLGGPASSQDTGGQASLEMSHSAHARIYLSTLCKTWLSYLPRGKIICSKPYSQLVKKTEFDLVLGCSWSPSADTDLLSPAAQSTEGRTSAHLTAKINTAFSEIVRK